MDVEFEIAVLVFCGFSNRKNCFISIDHLPFFTNHYVSVFLHDIRLFYCLNNYFAWMNLMNEEFNLLFT